MSKSFHMLGLNLPKKPPRTIRMYPQDREMNHQKTCYIYTIRGSYEVGSMFRGGSLKDFEPEKGFV